jgi:hypothetical protein
MKYLWFFFFLIASQISFAKIDAVQPKGNGTENSPYLLDCLGNFFWLNKMAERFTSRIYCKQIKDIDASATLNGGEDSWPVLSFGLNYDGQNYVISKPFISSFSQKKIRYSDEFEDDKYHNPKYYTNDFSGIFCSGALQLKNIVIEDIQVKNSGSGLLVGLLRSASRIDNCKIKNATGNIVGAIQYANLSSSGTQINNVSLENIIFEQNDTNLGGLIGRVSTSFTKDTNVSYLSISNCFTDVSFNGTKFQAIGGLIGRIDSQSDYVISKCSSKFKFISKVTSDDYSVEGIGGLIGIYGYKHGLASYNTIKVYIDNSHSISDITIDSKKSNGVGGILGKSKSFDNSSSLNAIVYAANDYSQGNINITGDSSGIGGLFGSLVFGSLGPSIYADNSYSSGTIKLSRGSYVGGLAGGVGKGKINNCHSKTSILGRRYLEYSGGIFGSGAASINDCFYIGTIEAKSGDNIGGLAGRSYRSYGSSPGMQDSYARATINVLETNGKIGGLVGTGTESDINCCYSRGIIKVASTNDIFHVGGIMGYSDSCDIKNSFSKTELNIKSEEICQGIGGIFGAVKSTASAQILHCYYSGKITCSDSIYLGSLVGDYGRSQVKECYFNSTICDLYDEYAEAKTDSEMKKASTFANWDFVGIWGIDEGKVTPFLKSVPEPSIIVLALFFLLVLAKKR